MPIPELEGLPKDEAKRLQVQVQKEITRQPAILAGLFGTVLASAFVCYWALPNSGLLGAAIIGGLIGVAAALYIKLVVTPRVRARLRAMGYPKPIA